MTAVAQSRVNIVLALAIPTAGYLYLTSSGFEAMNATAMGVTLGLGALWLAMVVTVNALPREHLAYEPTPRRAVTPSYVVPASQSTEPWRWTSVLLAPVELLAVAWSVPLIILLIMLPIGLALWTALWLGRLILNLF